MSVIRRYIDNRWNLDAHNLGVLPDDVRKKQFAYRIWREDLERIQKREDGKKSEIKDTWIEVYQLIGFDNVFQGVWFQGVTQLAQNRGCHFSIIPIILSVFVSFATIAAVYLKISKVRDLEARLLPDRSRSKGLHYYISACEHLGLAFDFDKIEADAGVLDNGFYEESVKSKAKSFILLLSLTIASILFAWLIRLIMCGEYV